jgi:hypothetical protein
LTKAAGRLPKDVPLLGMATYRVPTWTFEKRKKILTKVTSFAS